MIVLGFHPKTHGQPLEKGLPKKVLGMEAPYYQVVAHFAALDEGVLVAVLKSFDIFCAISKHAVALFIFMLKCEGNCAQITGKLINNFFSTPRPPLS